tara:strand:- start:123 stop:287 length:165 start_codon:yes stop_codon:yes gene_type:complete
LVQATRLHFGAVVKELNEGYRDDKLWMKAKELCGEQESLFLATYLSLRAEFLAD